jgi:ribosomal protein S18 acetylase RimI-like enzyme
MIEKLEIKEFDTVYAIMERSFPLEEYRSYEDQKALLKKPAYRIYAAKENGKILGFAAVWQLEDWLFLEHLAVDPQCRNQGIGAKLLRHFAQSRCCLEVELPETALCRRRIGFYERNGFFLNDYPYLQPSLGEGRSPVPLYIMTSGSAVSAEEFDRVKRLLYSRVYRQKE